MDWFETKELEDSIAHGDGYRLVYCPNHPSARKRGYIYEHRYIMEKHIGRFLQLNEIVHHKNENKSDNRIENLALMDRMDHMKIHLQLYLAGKTKKRVVTPCACGCGKTLENVDSKGRDRSFILGHHSRKHLNKNLSTAEYADSLKDVKYEKFRHPEIETKPGDKSNG